MTRYKVAGVTIRIGRRSPAMDQHLASRGLRAAIFVSASNPFSQRRPEGWNRRMHARLTEAASHAAARQPERTPQASGTQGTMRPLPATGSWRGWREAHLVLFGDPRPAMRLARRFRQNAVVIIKLRQPADLRWLSSSSLAAPGAARCIDR